MSFLFFELFHPKGRKTPIWYVLNSANRAKLGEIKWYPGWRRFVFHPEGLTIFDVACLNEISRFIAVQMAARKNLI